LYILILVFRQQTRKHYTRVQIDEAVTLSVTILQ
jgi:hypothetical protein